MGFPATHGETKTRLFKIWSSMKERCYRPTARNYLRYGGQGIAVCDEWKNDFVCFRDWALANGYSDSLTIDRLDNSGNYEPSNCKWSTYSDQNKNRKSNIYFDFEGKKLCLKDYCHKIGICYSTVVNRIHRGKTDIFKLPQIRKAEKSLRR
jgi:hypothetical protein